MREHFDAVVLDVMLPGIDGFQVVSRIRAESDIPVLMLTARGEDTDRIVGLELGADDYLPKPFNPRELLARIRALLRRQRRTESDGEAVLRFGGLTIDRDPSPSLPKKRRRSVRKFPGRPLPSAVTYDFYGG